MTAFIIQKTDVPDSSDTLSGACLDLALFKPRKAEDALLCLIYSRIEIGLFVRTGPYTVSVTPALLKVNEDYAVFFPLAYGLPRTCSETGGISAVVTKPGKIEIIVIGIVTAAYIFIPARSPGRDVFGFKHLVFAFHEFLIIKLPGLSIILDRR